MGQSQSGESQHISTEQLSHELVSPNFHPGHNGGAGDMNLSLDLSDFFSE
jgi:hypothetical protein